MSGPEAGGKRVLVLDPDIEMGALIVAALTRLGYSAASETNPAKSIRSIADGKFDILLTEYRMTGLTGLQVAHLLRVMDSMVPVILHTREGGDLNLDDLRLVGILGIIKKPLPVTEIVAAFASILQSTLN